MLETNLKRLESSEIITSKLDQIIEAFVSFYGESHRSEIETRLRNTQILKFSSVFTLSENIRKVKESILKELYDISEDKFDCEGIDNVESKDTYCDNALNKIKDFIPKRKKILDNKYIMKAMKTTQKEVIID